MATLQKVSPSKFCKHVFSSIRVSCRANYNRINFTVLTNYQVPLCIMSYMPHFLRPDFTSNLPQFLYKPNFSIAPRYLNILTSSNHVLPVVPTSCSDWLHTRCFICSSDFDLAVRGVKTERIALMWSRSNYSDSRSCVKEFVIPT